MQDTQNVNEHIESILQTLPDRPGVYLMLDENGDVIYVGKAKSLKSRVRQYFRSHKNHEPKVVVMVRKIRDIKYIVVETEMEALFLECNLIKEYRPRYNILLKDDKHYPYLRMDLREPYPRLVMVRKVQQDGAKYFGPYLETGSLTDALSAVSRNFPLRSCKKDIERAQRRHERPCLNYQIGRCAAPCAHHISQQEYAQVAQQVASFLQGKYDELLVELRDRMEQASRSQKYEQAAMWRDRIYAVERISVQQKAMLSNLAQRDALALARLDNDGAIHLFGINDGKLVNSQTFFMEDIVQEEDNAVITAFLQQHYSGQGRIPREVLTPIVLDEQALLTEFLSKLRGTRVHLHMPQRGEKKRLVAMAYQNAMETLTKRKARDERAYARGRGAMEELANAIGLSDVPTRMECYDISHTQGVDNVASMVVFENGAPVRKEYRRFKIRTVEGADDFKSMHEVITRRLLRAMEPDESSQKGFGDLPELIVVDGGRGQLNAAMSAMDETGFNIPMIGLAKRLEEIYIPGRDETILLEDKSPALHALMRIRDEAHRFAVTYHRSLRASREVQSAMDEIDGIGKTRKKALMLHYKTMEQIKQASVDDLCTIKGMSQTAAQSVYDYFHQQAQDE